MGVLGSEDRNTVVLDMLLDANISETGLTRVSWDSMVLGLGKWGWVGRPFQNHNSSFVDDARFHQLIKAQTLFLWMPHMHS